MQFPVPPHGLHFSGTNGSYSLPFEYFLPTLSPVPLHGRHLPVPRHTGHIFGKVGFDKVVFAGPWLLVFGKDGFMLIFDICCENVFMPSTTAVVIAWSACLLCSFACSSAFLSPSRFAAKIELSIVGS